MTTGPCPAATQPTPDPPDSPDSLVSNSPGVCVGDRLGLGRLKFRTVSEMASAAGAGTEVAKESNKGQGNGKVLRHRRPAAGHPDSAGRQSDSP
eukprot:6289251-Alexandrium_andersonii.AAC.1